MNTHAIAFCFLVWVGVKYTTAQNCTFRNPILDGSAQFHTVYKHQGSYYMTLTNGRTIEILKSPILSNFREAERREIYRAPPEYNRIRAPRMQFIRGNFYIYFSLDPVNGTLEDARLYVIKSLNSCSPLESWSDPVRLLPGEEFGALMPTVLEYYTGDIYLIWTGRISGSLPHNLFIARMESPVKAIGPRTLLRSPTMGWETQLGNVNEGPAILENHGATYLVFSASHSMSPDYCLGIMGIDGGRDPMITCNWWNDVDRCVFGKNEEDNVFGTGHASFVRSPDDSETWLAYQAWYGNAGYRNRTIRIQKLDWGEMNTPKFPRAVGLDADLEIPSGERD